MIKNHKKGVIEPLIFSVAVFVLTFLLVQYLAYQQYVIAQENEREKLQQELNRVKDGFRGILNSSITAANALAVIHKNYGETYNFDSAAMQLMDANKYVDAMQITSGGVITHVDDSTRKKEAEYAIKRNDIYFAGPRKFRLGGDGILGKVPIVSNGKLIGFSVVLTKMPTILAALNVNDSAKQIYSYRLTKNYSADSGGYYFTKTRPGDMAVSAHIPEGDWTLTVDYSFAARKNNFPVALPVIGLLLALFAGAFMYRRMRQPHYLNEIIDAKTNELSAREKYYRTITEANYDATVLLSEKGKVLYQTPSVEKITGYSLAEIQNANTAEIIHPDDRARDDQAFIRLISEPGNIVHLTHRIKNKGGSYIWLECTYRNLLHDENVHAIVLNYRDITDKVVAEHQLGERVKELTTIYYANEILKDEQQTVLEVFTKLVGILPPGWQYPEICAARIIFDGQEFRTKNYRPSDFVQTEHFSLIDGRQGTVEVLYIEERPVEYEGPFLKEERDLIRTLAETIVVYFNKASQQRELAKSEANFRSSFEHAAIGMALVAPGGEFMKVNNALCSMLGYSEEELMSLTFAKITHPRHLVADMENVKQILNGSKDFYRTEKRYVHKNGSVIWANLNSAIIRDGEHQPMYFVSQIENITEQKESQQKFQNLVEKSLVGVYIIQNGRFVYVNPRIIEESGYTEDELISVPFDRYLHKDDIDLVLKSISARLSGELREARYEVRAFKKNGELMWMEMFGSATVYQGAPAIIGTIINITEKKEIYNELARSEANLRSIFNNTQASFLLLDEHINILAFNEYLRMDYANQTGFDLQPGANYLELRLPDKRDLVKKAIESVKETGKPVEYETSYTNRKLVKHFSVTVSPVLNNSSVIGFCIVGFDITNRKNLEIEKQKIVADLFNRNRDLQEFAQIVSHNLRGPLATLLGLNNMLKDGVTEEEKDFILDGIGITSEKMDAVVIELNNILDVKQDSSETRTIVDLNELLGEIRQKFSDLIMKSHAGIETDFSAADNLFTLRSYAYNILYSLISNSLKYRDKQRKLHIRIWTERQPGAVVLTIQDNGIGIDMNKYRDQIFLLNKRFHNTSDGKGLGLYIVKAQVDILQGMIEIDSEPSVGTTVRLMLPV